MPRELNIHYIFHNKAQSNLLLSTRYNEKHTSHIIIGIQTTGDFRSGFVYANSAPISSFKNPMTTTHR